MKSIVNVIIPAYEASATLSIALSSIASQTIAHEISTTIVDDASVEDYTDTLKEFDPIMDLHLTRNPINLGCGLSRQVGIDMADTKYLMFLDADDVFYSVTAVEYLVSTAEKNRSDLVISDFYEELENHGLYLHEKDTVWMHGKLYRTGFLKDKNIRFNETRYNEDHAFNSIVLNCNAKNYYIKHPTYLWRWYSNSITRVGDYTIKGMDDYFVNCKYVISELIRRECSEDRICDVVRNYALTVFGSVNIHLSLSYPWEFIQSEIRSFRAILHDLPVSIHSAVRYETLSADFYRHRVINQLLSDGIIITYSLSDYICDLRLT